MKRSRGHCRRSPRSRSARLNIFSMRSVMMKPPTTLIVALVDRDEAEHGGDAAVGAGHDERADERDGR